MKTSVLLVLLLLAGQAHAQLRKCTGPDGKVTYSDVLCAGGSSATSIKTPNSNSLDMSGMRRQIENAQAKERQDAAQQAITKQDCKFEYYSVGDAKGQQLAANAKAECLRNNEAKVTGGPTSLEHYNFWKDHRAVKTTQRTAAIAESNAAARATKNRSMTCKPNVAGTALDCNE